MGVYVDVRSRKSALKLWNSLPPVYCQCAGSFTDFWTAYEEFIPKKRHQAVGKESGVTNHIERCNNTLRQRIWRLVSQTLSFDKKLDNHLGAIWYFLHHYNASLRVYESYHYIFRTTNISFFDSQNLTKTQACSSPKIFLMFDGCVDREKSHPRSGQSLNKSMLLQGRGYSDICSVVIPRSGTNFCQK